MKFRRGDAVQGFRQSFRRQLEALSVTVRSRINSVSIDPQAIETPQPWVSNPDWTIDAPAAEYRGQRKARCLETPASPTRSGLTTRARVTRRAEVVHQNFGELTHRPTPSGALIAAGILRRRLSFNVLRLAKRQPPCRRISANRHDGSRRHR